MREAIGGTWIFTIVIVFIVLFSGYLAISVNYTKAFRVKNQIITIIEQKEGLTDGENGATGDIEEYLNTIGYAVYGKCAAGETGFLPKANSNTYKYCVSKRESGDGNSTLKKTYYSVRVWFRLDLPILGNLFTFPVSGETKAVYYAKDNIK